MDAPRFVQGAVHRRRLPAADTDVCGRAGDNARAHAREPTAVSQTSYGAFLLAAWIEYDVGFARSIAPSPGTTAIPSLAAAAPASPWTEHWRPIFYCGLRSGCQSFCSIPIIHPHLTCPMGGAVSTAAGGWRRSGLFAFDGLAALRAGGRPWAGSAAASQLATAAAETSASLGYYSYLTDRDGHVGVCTPGAFLGLRGSDRTWRASWPRRDNRRVPVGRPDAELSNGWPKALCGRATGART